MTFYRLDAPDALELTEFHSEAVCRNSLSRAPHCLDLRAGGSDFVRSLFAATHICFPAILGLLSAMVQSVFPREVICSKSALWVPLLLLNFPTLISWPPDLQMMRA